MNKTFKLYIAIWAVLFILFNAVSFLSFGAEIQDKFTVSFVIGYAFITLAFIGQLPCAYFAFNQHNIKKTFYNLPLVGISFTGLFLSFIFGGVCMLIESIPYWVGALGAIAIVCFTCVALLNAGIAIGAVSSVDDKVASGTYIMKSLAVDAEVLVRRAKSEEAKSECVRVYEAIRYSDPMTNESLAAIENEIVVRLSKLYEVVEADDIRLISEHANGLIIAVETRNKNCKLLKHR